MGRKTTNRLAITVSTTQEHIVNNAEAMLAGIDPRKMSRLWQSMFKHGIIDKVMFAPEGRDIVDVRVDEKTGRILKRIYPVMQFTPYPLKEYLAIVVDVGPGQDGAIVSRSILLNPYDEDISTDEWQDDDKYLDRLIGNAYVTRGNRGDAVVRINGRIAICRKESYPPTLNAENRILLIERMYTNEFVVIPPMADRGQEMQRSDSNTLAVMGSKYGITSPAQNEMLKFVKVEAKPGQRAPSITSDDGLRLFENRVSVTAALGNPKYMGNVETLPPDASAEQIRKAVKALAASIHPDLKGMDPRRHPFLQQRSVLGVKISAGGAVEGGPYIFRREVEFMLVFLRSLIEKANAYADTLAKPADLSALPKDREQNGGRRKRNRGGRGRGGNRDNVQAAETQQAPASEPTDTAAAPEGDATEAAAPAVVISRGNPADSDDWSEATDALEVALTEAIETRGIPDNRFEDELADAGETAADTSATDEEVEAPAAPSQAAAAIASTDPATRLAAIQTRLETETDMLPNVRKHLKQELQRLQRELSGASKPKAEKAKKDERPEPMKGFGALGNLAALAGKKD